MFGAVYLTHHETVVRIVQRVLEATVEWPNLRYVAIRLHELGISADCLDSAPSNRIYVEQPRDLDSRVIVTVRGLADVDSSLSTLEGFVPTLRRCYDEYVCQGGTLASSERPVEAVADTELLGKYEERLAGADVMIAGLLLEAHGLAACISRLPDEAPGVWKATLLPLILQFGAVGSISDFLAILDDLEGRPEDLL